MAKKSQIEKQASPLSELLTKDKQLQEDKQRLTLFLSLAKMYDEDVENNLTRNSFELDEKYPVGSPKVWLEFINYGAVRNYIEAYIDDLQLAGATKHLLQTGGLDRVTDALTVKREVEEKRRTKNNNNIVVFCMPQRKYMSVGDYDVSEDSE